MTHAARDAIGETCGSIGEMRFLALLVPLVVLAGCNGGGDDDDSPSPGSFELTVGCSGVACGLTGSLKIPIHEDDCVTAPLLTISLPAVTTSAASPVTETLNLENRAYCIEAWLDDDEDGTLSTGDAIDSAGGIIDVAAVGTPLLFTLDALQP